MYSVYKVNNFIGDYCEMCILCILYNVQCALYNAQMLSFSKKHILFKCIVYTGTLNRVFR